MDCAALLLRQTARRTARREPRPHGGQVCEANGRSRRREILRRACSRSARRFQRGSAGLAEPRDGQGGPAQGTASSSASGADAEAGAVDAQTLSALQSLTLAYQGVYVTLQVSPVELDELAAEQADRRKMSPAETHRARAMSKAHIPARPFPTRRIPTPMSRARILRPWRRQCLSRPASPRQNPLNQRPAQKLRCGRSKRGRHEAGSGASADGRSRRADAGECGGCRIAIAAVNGNRLAGAGGRGEGELERIGPRAAELFPGRRCRGGRAPAGTQAGPLEPGAPDSNAKKEVAAAPAANETSMPAPAPTSGRGHSSSPHAATGPAPATGNHAETASPSQPAAPPAASAASESAAKNADPNPAGTPHARAADPSLARTPPKRRPRRSRTRRKTRRRAQRRRA